MAASHLAYLDLELDAYPHLEALVDSMVQEEMASFKPKDYLRELGLPEVPDFSGSPLLQAEMRRLAAGEEGMAPMDQTRYRVDPPSGAQAGSTEAWEDAVRNARSQLEHQRNRMTNLELLSKFGPNTWRLGASDLAGVKERCVDAVFVVLCPRELASMRVWKDMFQWQRGHSITPAF